MGKKARVCSMVDVTRCLVVGVRVRVRVGVRVFSFYGGSISEEKHGWLVQDMTDVVFGLQTECR